MITPRYIPINKGHFDLDTPERIGEFHRKLASGWENDYADYRQLWKELPQKQVIRDYPLLVDLELASACNLKCPMCYTITPAFKNTVKKGFMDYALFTEIVDEIADHIYALRLSFRGEPTLHKRFLDCLRYAKQRGIREVSMLTNGAFLEADFFQEMAHAGMDWITISVDGTDEEYNRIRYPLTFADTLRRIEEIHDFKQRHDLTKPVIKVQGVWPAIRPNPTQYYETLAPVTDLVAYNPLIDYLREDADILYEDKFSCPQLYQRIVVGSDGQVLMCSNDEDNDHVVGNANRQTIHQVWHGDKLNSIREVHKITNEFKKMKACRQCYYPRTAKPNEIAEVSGRRIKIENYINRVQIIR
ncbi:radical SAM/SPASM domain-containing protein [Thiorhodovibrio frisius]|uniref:Radical SAM superfamily enzyme n=1 Tax=Thiorhodovibrio frisius TaxID=631362 RepID=H8Z0A8_9GAMM|nr:radical SAM/SPASM domain-containing protein [Thiorhodovibrio frisius]EIC22316.1 radical SAM superfamily enzyme [Thiorhodovibrio frisius]WPL24613.1 molybdenum cofactor biosynthesis protein A [Thiorhodovibrio frisius]